MTTADLAPLYRVRAGAFDVVEVPEVTVAVVPGVGDPDGEDFAAALQALYSVSYAAHFLVKKAKGEAPKVMPLEALWWVDDAVQRDMVHAAARGEGDLRGADRSTWRWQAMIVQQDPIDDDVLERAVAKARTKELRALDDLRVERWTEGLSAQVLHVGPYSAEAPSIARLHEGITAAGYRPRGRHHEIYLSDARRTAPEKLRTILRQPVERA